MYIHASHVFNRHKNGKPDAIATKHLLLMYKIQQLFSFPLWFFKIFFLQCFNVPCGIFRSTYLGKSQQLQTIAISVCSISVSKQWYGSVSETCNKCINVDVCDWTWGCTDTVRVCTVSCLWERSSLPHQGPEPASELNLAFQWDAPLTELSLPRAFLVLLLLTESCFLVSKLWFAVGWFQVSELVCSV